MRKLIQELRAIFCPEALEFEDYLSPEVVNLLLREYAVKSKKLGMLQWQYKGSLGSRTWGQYSPGRRTLFVSKKKTKNLFKGQVETILHEIQHWNQHADAEDRGVSHSREYSWEKARAGYWDNKFERDARNFATKNLEGAMRKIADLARSSGSVAGSLDDAIEDIVDTYGDEGKVTRFQIGTVLKDYGLNSAANMATAIKELTDLGLRLA